MKIEKSPDRLTARSEVMSLPSGLAILAFLCLWVAVAARDLPEAWACGSWGHVARPLGGIAVGTLLFGGSALFALGHQRLTLSRDGIENAWVVVGAVRRRSVPLADIKSIDTVTISGQESDSTYLSVRTARRQVRWTLFSDDPADLRKAIETVLVGLRRKNQ